MRLGKIRHAFGGRNLPPRENQGGWATAATPQPHPLYTPKTSALSTTMSSAALPRLALRQSRWVIQRRAASTTSEAASNTASQGASKAKEGASEAAGKAQQGLSRVTSSAGSAVSSTAASAGKALNNVGGRTGQAIQFVQGKDEKVDLSI